MLETEIKNKITVRLNDLSNGVSGINRVLSKRYSKDFSNIAEVYREKLLKLEKLFKEIGMPFYTGNILGTIIIHQLNEILNESYSVLNDISNVLEKIPSNHILAKIYLLSHSKLISKYEEICEKMQSFSLSDINKYAYNYFKTIKAYEYRPNWFYENYDNLKNIMIKLNIDIENIDNELLSIIEKQESGIRILYECAILETGSLCEDDIRNFINKLVTGVTEQIPDKQKKRV